MFVIDFEQVNAPGEAFNVIAMRHLNAQSSSKSSRKKYEICLGDNYSEKKVWWKFHVEKLSETGGYCPEGNYLEVIVRGSCLWGNYSGSNYSWGEFDRGQLPGGGCLGRNYLKGVVRGAKVQK